MKDDINYEAYAKALEIAREVGHMGLICYLREDWQETMIREYGESKDWAKKKSNYLNPFNYNEARFDEEFRDLIGRVRFAWHRHSPIPFMRRDCRDMWE